MASLVAEGIDYAKSAHMNEALQAIEVNQWLEGMVDTGAVCRLVGRAHSPYRGALRALTRAVQNLLANAHKYGGEAEVVVEDSPSVLVIRIRIRIRIRDRGPGLPEALLETVFDPFFRAEGSRNRGNRWQRPGAEHRPQPRARARRRHRACQPLGRRAGSERAP